MRRRPGRPATKLTDVQAEEIRRRYHRGLGPALAAEYGIALSYVYDVIHSRVHRPARARVQQPLSMTPTAIRQRRYYARKRGELPPCPPRKPKTHKPAPQSRPAPRAAAPVRPAPPPAPPPRTPRDIVRAAWARREEASL